MMTRTIARRPGPGRWLVRPAAFFLSLVLGLVALTPNRARALPVAPPAPAAGEATQPAVRAKEFDYTGWNAFLQKYVQGGLVDYAALAGSRARELDAVVDAMSRYAWRTVFSKEARIAFLINAYNALAIRDALKAYPPARPEGGPKDIPGFFDKVTHPLDGGQYTLDQIENDLITSIVVKEPRYHLAVCRAAVGAPPLRSTAFTGDSLSMQLESLTRAYLTDTKRTLFDAQADTLYLPEVLQWHRRDFEWGEQTLVRFVAPHFSLGTMMKLMQAEPPIVYRPFDWRLNDVRNREIKP